MQKQRLVLVLKRKKRIQKKNLAKLGNNSIDKLFNYLKAEIYPIDFLRTHFCRLARIDSK